MKETYVSPETEVFYFRLETSILSTDVQGQGSDLGDPDFMDIW